MMEDEQPKDYSTLEEYWEHGWNSLSTFEKITYYMQEYVYLVCSVGIIIGYLIGVFFPF